MRSEIDDAPLHLVRYLSDHAVNAEFLAPGVPMPTVPAAAAALGVPDDLILKTLLFTGKNGDHVVVVANGTRRVDRTRLEKVTGLVSPRVASPQSVIDVTGYPAGGVAPLGFATPVPVLVDRAVTALPIAFGGGGREHLLLRLDPADIVRLNNALVAQFVEDA